MISAAGWFDCFIKHDVVADALFFFVRYCGIAPYCLVVLETFYDAPYFLSGKTAGFGYFIDTFI